MKKKLFIIALAIVTSITALVSCTNGGNDRNEGQSDLQNGQNNTTDSYVLKVGTLKGPTGMGMAKVISDTNQSSANAKYSFDLFGAPEDITAQLLNGSLDVAAVPVNLAATIFNKTQGEYLVAAINTLGVLHIVENGNTVNDISDLEGKTLYATGQASTPEYMLNYILEKNGLKDKVNIVWKTEHSELATLVAAGEVDLALLPEPHVTSAIVKNSSLRVAIDLTAEWDKVCDGDAVQGCIVVSKKAIANHKALVDEFLTDYNASVTFVNTNITEASEIIAGLGIVGAAKVAQMAIPRCNIVFIEGDPMVTSLNEMFNMLYTANPKSIGGTLPDDSIYYKR